jgi:Tfp pilus assembly protein PilE
MFRLPCNNRGFTLVEVVIAIFITVVAVLGILALISPGWKTAARSDSLGRASGILYETLMTQEALILNPCCLVAEGATGPTTVFASGQTTAQPGDRQFNVTTTITSIGTNVWSVNVLVAWTGHSGISETLVVTRQEGFRAGCAPATTGVITCQ